MRPRAARRGVEVTEVSSVPASSPPSILTDPRMRGLRPPIQGVLGGVPDMLRGFTQLNAPLTTFL